jgi:enoyl-CoA hydratase
VNDVHEDASATHAAARALAGEMARNSPLAVEGVKQVMNERVGPEDEDGLRHVATWNAAFLPSLDLGEALSSFAEKRPPQYRGA